MREDRGGGRLPSVLLLFTLSPPRTSSDRTSSVSLVCLVFRTLPLLEVGVLSRLIYLYLLFSPLFFSTFLCSFTDRVPGRWVRLSRN